MLLLLSVSAKESISAQEQVEWSQGFQICTEMELEMQQFDVVRRLLFCFFLLSLSTELKGADMDKDDGSVSIVRSSLEGSSATCFPDSTSEMYLGIVFLLSSFSFSKASLPAKHIFNIVGTGCLRHPVEYSYLFHFHYAIGFVIPNCNLVIHHGSIDHHFLLFHHVVWHLLHERHVTLADKYQVLEQET